MVVKEKPKDSPPPSTKTLGCNWHQISFRHKRLLGKSVTGAGPHKGKYAGACALYGEDVVLECFEEWALAKRAWVKANDVNAPLYLFWKDLPDMATVTVDVKKAEHQDAEKRTAELARKAQDDANIEAGIQRQKQKLKELWTRPDPPKNGDGADPLEYVAEAMAAAGLVPEEMNGESYE